MDESRDRLSRYRACMLLGGVGDALGFNDGKWEFCPSGEQIQEEARRMGGVSALRPTASKMRVSDDTVLHLATAEALLSPGSSDSQDQLCLALAAAYKQAMRDMNGRRPGLTSINSAKQLFPDFGMCTIPFNQRGGGCGAAMRAVPIGLLYWRPKDIESLVRVAVEAGRMTHNHPTGFLGSVAVAVFVSYAVRGKPVREWGEGLMDTLPIAKRYCEQQKRDWRQIQENWGYFEEQWRDYLNLVMPRNKLNLKPMSAYEYDQFTLKLSYLDNPGSSGHDAPMIAYDALLRSMQVPSTSRWETVCRYGMFHGGDSDSTGIIAGACYGAMFGLEGVPHKNYYQLEYRDRLERLGRDLYTVTVSDSLIESKYRDFPENSKSKLVLHPDRKLFDSSLAQSVEISEDDSFSIPSPGRRGRVSQKKRVTFKDPSPQQRSGEEGEGRVEPDLFVLASMHLDEAVSEEKMAKQRSILKRRSRSHSPTRSSGHLADLKQVDKFVDEVYNSKEESNIYRGLDPNSTHSTFDGKIHYKYSSTKFADNPFDLLNNITKQTDLQVNPSRDISYPLRSRTDFTSTQKVERVIKYPPRYEEKRILKPPSSCSYGKTTDG